MALYALGDLHLSFQADKPMDAFGNVWKHHERKIEKYVNRIVKPRDTLVLTGDHSWGRKLSQCREDLAFIERLPGRKILLRGNHDMFWDAKKTRRLNEEYDGRLFFLQNNFAAYQDYALVGTKGYTFEGPFYLNFQGKILGWDEEREAQAKKLVARELERLRESFRQAEEAGYRKFVMFLHYPPTSVLERTSPFTEIAEEYGVEAVVYSHCHGEQRFGDSIRGNYRGIRYLLVSGDYLNFHPELVLP
nr:metallophosphoesterase [uncultured Sellimonas sp.]